MVEEPAGSSVGGVDGAEETPAVREEFPAMREAMSGVRSEATSRRLLAIVLW